MAEEPALTPAERRKAQARARYQAKLAGPKCVLCNDRPKEPGLTCCRICLDKQNAGTASRREEYAPRQRELAEAWRQQRIKDGICTQCNDNPARPGRQTCEVCGHRMAMLSSQAFAAARTEVLDHYGHKCSQCPESHRAFLQVDHIDGGGNAHRREIGWSQLFRWLIAQGFPPGFQILCASCNFEKMLTQVRDPIELPEGDTTCVQCRLFKARKDRVLCVLCAAKRRTWDALRQLRLRDQVLNHYGRACKCCGSTRALQMDHIDGGGNIHRREIGGGQLYPWLIKNGFPSGYQPLCANCNFAKGHGGCPHQTGEARRSTTVDPANPAREFAIVQRLLPEGPAPKETAFDPADALDIEGEIPNEEE